MNAIVIRLLCAYMDAFCSHDMLILLDYLENEVKAKSDKIRKGHMCPKLHFGIGSK